MRTRNKPCLEHSLPKTPAATIQSSERLHGGISSLVHGVCLRVGLEVQHFVLRRFDNAEWLRDEPDLVRHEAESLRQTTHRLFRDGPHSA